MSGLVLNNVLVVRLSGLFSRKAMTVSSTDRDPVFSSYSTSAETVEPVVFSVSTHPRFGRRSD